YTYDRQPVIIIGGSRWNGPDNKTSQNLIADAAQGAYSVTIANASSFAVGQFVLVDETSGASWQPTVVGYGCSDNSQPAPCPPLLWQGDRVAWQMHWPQQVFRDDSANANAFGPYDSTPGTPPGAEGWFAR